MNFDALFSPASVAIIGASTRPGSVGNDLVKNLQRQGYRGHIYPVNPKAQPLYGLTTYASVTAIGKPVDLAVLAIPAELVVKTLEEVADCGTQAVVVISAGFKETGEEGAKRELEMQDVVKRRGLTLIGPNCLGVLNPHIDLNISFARAIAKKGNVAFISQSGALCSSVLDYAQEYGIGFSKFVSVGNKACIDEADIVDYLAKDPETKVVLLYAESLHDGERFMQSVRRLTHGENAKPLIAIKSGVTAKGGAASASHTGALAGNDAAYNALLLQSGAIRVSSVEDLFVFAAAFSHNGQLQGNRIAVVSNAGGPGVLVTDELIKHDLTLAEFSDETKQKLASSLPPAANIRNPVDVLGDALSDRYFSALEAVGSDPGVDGIIAILTPQSMTDIVQTAIAVSNAKLRWGKPLIASFMGAASTHEANDMLRRHGVANMLFPESAAHAMSALYDFYRTLKEGASDNIKIEESANAQTARTILQSTASSGGYIKEPDTMSICKLYGIPVPEHWVVSSESELSTIPKDDVYVLKVVSQDIVHKTDVGGVTVGVKGDDLQSAYTTLIERVSKAKPNAHIESVLVAKMHSEKGIEFVIGVKKEEGLGHLIMFGMGGIFIEVLKDVSFRITPATRQEIESMLFEPRVGALLRGVRGSSKLDINALVDVIMNVQTLIHDNPQIKELDLNPIVVMPEGKGVMVLDGRIVIK